MSTAKLNDNSYVQSKQESMNFTMNIGHNTTTNKKLYDTGVITLNGAINVSGLNGYNTMKFNSTTKNNG